VRATKKLIVSALASAGALGLTVFPGTRALADGTSIPASALGLASFHQLAVAGNDVFLTGAPDSGSGIVVTDLSGRRLTTLDKGADVAGIARQGSTLYAKLTSGSNAGSVAAIPLPTSGAAVASFAEHYISLLGGLLPSSLQGLSSALNGTGQTTPAAGQNISEAGNKATGSGSVISVYNPDGSVANVINLGDRALAPGGLAWAGSTLVAVTKDADGLYRVESFLNAAVRKAVPKVTLPTLAPSKAPSSTPSPAKSAPGAKAKKSAPKLPTELTISAPSRAAYKPKIAVQVHLGSTSGNRTVAVYAQRPGSARKLIKKGTVDWQGNLSVDYTTPFTTTFTAVYSGDAVHQSKTVSHTTTVTPRMSMAVNGWYGTTQAGGETYREFHKASDIDVDLTVAPDKAHQCVWFQVQELYNGTWHANMKTSCVPLNSASKLSGYLGLTNADPGYHYRVQAHYLPVKGDGWNGGTATAWQYLLPEN